MIDHGYCTLPELQSWNSATATAQTENQERAIEAASRAIDQYTQRHFWQDGTSLTPKARTFPAPTDQRVLCLGEFNDLTPVVAPVVKTDDSGDGVFETTWTAGTDYELLPLNPAGAPEQRPYTTVRATGMGRWFPVPTCTGRLARVEVTGIWGWPAIPVDVTQACLILASRFYKRKESPDGVSNWGDLGVIRIGRTDPDVMALLDPYRRTAVLVA